MSKLWDKFQSQWTHMSKKAKTWLLWGVSPALVLLIFLVGGDMWVGYSLIQAISNHFLDFSLTMITLAISIVSASVDLNRNITKNDQRNIIGASAGLAVLSIFIFCFFYYRELLLEKGFEDIANLTPPSMLNVAHAALVIFAFFIIHTGIVLENK